MLRIRDRSMEDKDEGQLNRQQKSLDASLDVSLAYLEYQECFCFTNELSLTPTFGWASSLYLDDRPGDKG